MGMFDWVSIHKSRLPDNLKKTGWQTKDYHSTLDTLRIAEDGTLWLVKTNWDFDYPTPDECSIGERIYYTGEIRCLDSVKNIRTVISAYFDNGQLVKLIQVEPKIENED